MFDSYILSRTKIKELSWPKNVKFAVGREEIYRRAVIIGPTNDYKKFHSSNYEIFNLGKI